MAKQTVFKKITTQSKLSSRKSTDTLWWELLDKLEGSKGLEFSTGKERGLIAKLIEAVNDKDGLPEDLNSPDGREDGNKINAHAATLYNLFCEGADIAERMMLGGKVFLNYYNSIENKKGNTILSRDKYNETGHTRGDF